MKSVIRPLLLATTMLLSACAAPRPVTKSAATYPWFPFTWHTAKLSGKEHKVALLVPVKVKDLDANFIAQFDLGSDATLLYGEALKNYFATRAQLYALLDTTRSGMSDSGIRNYGTTGLPVVFGPMQVARPLFMSGYGDEVPQDSLHTKSPKSVGTIGGDFVAGKVLVIDYPQQRMCVLNSVDAYWEARTTFVKSRVSNNTMHIPLTIAQQKYWVLFDTGSSLFSFTSDEKTWRALAQPGPPTDTLTVNSWGKQVAFYAAPMQSRVYLGSYQLPAANAWFTRDQRQLEFMKATKVAGITGNALFQEKVVVLDFKGLRFGIVK
ncbi:hypothetical protein CDA63_00705 [Hymenobacter amundsenii]|uniref:Peptidase A2 domain-containing protein n=1 Tax=Hymenobacter amundsenii TaxID=2006685 RepID=A0A246FQB8_9BACT|nr:hypothetical protein [Hymenobacter amundsenii]OWP64910.1 hypothetical protein CDA63_00705 [Hymenobacter amundsenii]